MRHLVIDLDTKVRLLLLDDDTILDVHSVEFTNTVTSILISVIEHFMPEKVTYITHNILSQCLYNNSIIAFEIGSGSEKYASLINASDVDVCMNICMRAGITNVSFIDKLGYYMGFAQSDTCFVEKYTGIYRLIYIDGDNVIYSICTPDVYEETLKRFKNQTGATIVKNESELTDVKDLMYFTNSAMCLDDDEVVHDLAIFAYACLHVGKFRYVPEGFVDLFGREEVGSVITNNKEDNETSKVLCNEVTKFPKDDEDIGEFDGNYRENNIDHVTDDLLGENASTEASARRDKKKMKKSVHSPKPKLAKSVKHKKTTEPSSTQKRSRKGSSTFTVNLLVFVSIIALVFTGILYLLTSNQNTRLMELNKILTGNQAMITSINTAITNYQSCLEDNNEKILEVYANTISVIDVTDDTYVKTFNYANDDISMTLHTDSSTNKDKLQEMCDQNGYNIIITDLNPAEDLQDQQQANSEEEQDASQKEKDKHGKNKAHGEQKEQAVINSNFDIEISVSGA